MARTPAIGKQDFSKVIEENCFYVDKTYFIKEWWESKDDVTLITRPRRFGKTLTMSTLDYFFSIKHAGRGDLFEGLFIWEDEKYRQLQGTYPVISLSFAGIKANSFNGVYRRMRTLVAKEYCRHAFLLKTKHLAKPERKQFERIMDENVEENDIGASLNFLSEYLYRCYNKRTIILLDEYDTPMQEAYVNGYWEEISDFTRELFHLTFKTNPYLERGLLTGITKVSKESIFSDLNNLKVISATSGKYASAFGFTESEVFSALQEFGLEHEMDEVKYWYNGFRFGEHSEIYNPWSIINYLDEHKFLPYWANTSSNELVSSLVRKGSKTVKHVMEDLLSGKSFYTEIDEQIVFKQLKSSESAIWSLLLASGYLKVLSADGEDYELALTNHEIEAAFKRMVRGWFSWEDGDYNDFVNALLQGNLEEMNRYLNAITVNVISSFDSGTKPSGTEPEKFYHGLVLGLLVALEGRYAVTSNRESGYGRCDVMLEPLQTGDDGIILEFKVQNTASEPALQDTVDAALKQIVDKKYAAALAKKAAMNRIRIYGFAFTGKKVLIGGGPIGEFDS